MLKIQKTSAIANDKELVKNVSLVANKGEIISITGPLYSGKSGLLHMINGHPGIYLHHGSIYIGKTNINKLSPYERSKLGLFTIFQHPISIEHITNLEIVKKILNARGDKRTDAKIKKDFNDYCSLLGLDESHGYKPINNGILPLAISKKNEILQMLMVDPKILLVDEVDCGLNQKDSELIGNIISQFIRNKNKTCILVSRNEEFLNIVSPTRCYNFSNGELTY